MCVGLTQSRDFIVDANNDMSPILQFAAFVYTTSMLSLLLHETGIN